MKPTFIALMLLCLPGYASAQADVAPASEAQPAAAAKPAREADYTLMVEEAEQVRAEAERARREAVRVAERARESAELREMERREQRERSEAISEERERLRATQQREMERAREELSRAHRELREAQREVARAHRDLGQNEAFGFTTRVVNLGDKPVIGIVMGEETDNGVKLVGVSPDGPADEAGVKVGDVLVAINGRKLDDPEAARTVVFSTMETVKAGDSVELGIERDGKTMDIAVIAEVREPASWQSLVRIPEIETVRRIEGGPDEHRILIESTVAPRIDEEAMAKRLKVLRENLDSHDIHIAGDGLRVAPDIEDIEMHGNYTIEYKDFSDFADHAFSTASVSFGMPRAQGLKLAEVNEGLGAYFKTDHGVLVLEAKEDNAYQLEAGDVILKVRDSDVNAPSDLVRALRNVEPGDEIEIEIKRDRRNKTLKVTVPENRFGLR